MRYLAFFSVLAISASAIVSQPVGPVEPIAPILPNSGAPIVFIPGWPNCPNCIFALQADEDEHAECFKEPAHHSPCTYYYCCGEPVSPAAIGLAERRLRSHFLGHVRR